MDSEDSGSMLEVQASKLKVRNAFSLVEILVSMSVLVLILFVLLSIINSTQRIWKQTSTLIDAFRAARVGFESMTRRISQATLNTYWDYDSATAPKLYVRRSELRFISGNLPDVATALASSCPTHAIFFQAPLGFVSDTATYGGMENLLNTFGYYIAVTSDSTTRPPFLTIPAHTRFRLMQLSEPSENLTLYAYTSGSAGYKGTQWFSTLLSSGSYSHIVADNVVALVFLPKKSAQEDPGGTSLAPAYSYTTAPSVWPPAATPQTPSENQLPPLVQVTMVVLDESSAARLETISGGDAATMVTKLYPQTLFQSAGSLTDSTQAGYAQDLKTLTNTLQSLRLNYRVFSSEVSIRGAKWSKY